MTILGLNLGYDVLILAILTLGLALSLGLLGVLNMAHGELIMLGAYCALTIQRAGLPYLLAIPLACVVCGTVGLLIERVIIRPVNYAPFETLLGTWGAGMALRELANLIWGSGFQSVTLPVSGTVSLGEDLFPAWRLLVIVVAALFLLALGAWYNRASTALRVRAMVSNPALAQAVGINHRRLSASTFALSGAFAGIAGVLIAPSVPIEPAMGTVLVVNSFFALVLGGFGSLTGLMAGSGVIGGAQTLLATQLSPTTAYLAVLVIAILSLWLRPNGIFNRS